MGAQPDVEREKVSDELALRLREAEKALSSLKAAAGDLRLITPPQYGPLPRGPLRGLSIDRHADAISLEALSFQVEHDCVHSATTFNGHR
jgi:hypothetical protein